MRQSAFKSDDGTSLKKPLMAGLIGNFIEWYDFGIYGYLAVYLAANFFTGEGLVPLLATFATFAVAFLFRPLGGLFFGSLGDRYGRKLALTLVVLGISVATLGIGLLPTQAQIGALAPVLLLVCRSIQGFCAGGEYAGASSFLFEYAPKHRRGLFGGFLGMSTYAAFLAGAAFSYALSSNLSAEDMHSWGWRIPFLLGAPLGLVGLYIRLRIEETPAFTKVEEAHEKVERPLRTALRENWVRIVILTGFLFSNAVGPYLLITYIPSYLTKSIGLTPAHSLETQSWALVIMLILLPIFGRLSDTIGRKPIMLTSALLYIATPLPAFLLFGTGGTTEAFFGQVLIVVAQAASIAITAVVLCEMFPTKVRYTCAAVSYNTAYMLFGGTAPLVATYLVEVTGDKLSPAYYVMIVAAISAVFVTRLPETLERLKKKEVPSQEQARI
jgi:MHS family proline/betaine transporter-like MFS transporter